MKNKKIILLLLTFFYFLIVKGQQTINSENSSVKFSISNMKFNTVNGSFSDLSGTIFFTTTNLTNSKFNVSIAVSSIDTGSKGRDKHLMKEDFFDVEVNPKIEFVSSSIIKAKTPDYYIVTGKLKLHGVTKVISFPFIYRDKTFKGSLKLNRLDYKLGENTNQFLVGNEVEIEISTVIN